MAKSGTLWVATGGCTRAAAGTPWWGADEHNAVPAFVYHMLVANWGVHQAGILCIRLTRKPVESDEKPTPACATVPKASGIHTPSSFSIQIDTTSRLVNAEYSYRQ